MSHHRSLHGGGSIRGGGEGEVHSQQIEIVSGRRREQHGALPRDSHAVGEATTSIQEAD